MANISDAQVTIHAEKVGKELVRFINATHTPQVYYTFIDDNPTKDMVDEEGNFDMDSSSGGRWNYESNLRGYLDPEEIDRWLGPDNVAIKEAYIKLCDAIKRRHGQVTIDYTDCDPACEWMGSGVATLEEIDGEVVFSCNFEEEDYTVTNFAAMQGEDEFWALTYMYGEEVAELYDKYLKDWHNDSDRVDQEPACIDEWLGAEYQELLKKGEL